MEESLTVTELLALFVRNSNEKFERGLSFIG